MNPDNFSSKAILSKLTASDPWIDPMKRRAPAAFFTDITTIPVLMQGQRPYCVEHAVASYIMWLVFKTTGKLVRLSPRFLAALAVRQDDFAPGIGSTLKSALKMAKKYGICEEQYFPNDVELDDVSYLNIGAIPQAAYDNALQYRIEDFYFLTDTSEEAIKKSIYEWGLILYGIGIDDAWWTNTTGQTSWQQKDVVPVRSTKPLPNPTYSHHIVLGYGYDATPENFIRNSWSQAWGMQGNTYFTSADFPYVYEAAIITDLKQDTDTAQQSLLSRLIAFIASLFGSR